MHEFFMDLCLLHWNEQGTKVLLDGIACVLHIIVIRMDQYWHSIDYMNQIIHQCHYLKIDLMQEGKTHYQPMECVFALFLAILQHDIPITISS